MDLPPSRRVILHTDVNSAYANMERVFNPKLRDRPTPTWSGYSTRNCATNPCAFSRTTTAASSRSRRTQRRSASNGERPTSRFGISVRSTASPSSRPTTSSTTPCPRAFTKSSRFLDLTGVETESFTELGRALKARLWKWIGLPVCVGIAPTKTLAKLCDHFAKTYPVYGGVVNWFDLSPERRKKALSITPIGEVWGIGRKTEEKLLREGIENVWQFSQADVFTLRRRYGVVLERTLREIQGVSCLPVESVPKPKEQILRSRSFSHATNDRSVLLSSVSTHMTEVARQLRREKAEAKKAGVFFLTSPFKENEPWHAAEPVTELTLPTSDTMRLVEVACRLVEAHWRPGFRYCKAGAFVTDLIPEGSCSVTGSLFDLPDEERDATRRRLMECLDDLTRRFGKGVWKIGSSGLADGWQMKRDRLTPAYLTRWADIMTVS